MFYPDDLSTRASCRKQTTLAPKQKGFNVGTWGLTTLLVRAEGQLLDWAFGTTSRLYRNSASQLFLDSPRKLKYGQPKVRSKDYRAQTKSGPQSPYVFGYPGGYSMMSGFKVTMTS